MTAVGFMLFARHPADVLLLEVGLGGRFDATNVVDHPLATVITSISFDHVEHLGDSITKIAGEKAGILKAGAPAIVAPQVSEAVLQICSSGHSTVVRQPTRQMSATGSQSTPAAHCPSVRHPTRHVSASQI